MNEDMDKFHNTLRIMVGIDRHELVESGALDADDAEGWLRFDNDPYRWFICARYRRAEAVWSIIERRQPARFKAKTAAIY